MPKDKKETPLFPEIAPRGGIIPNRSASIECIEVLLARRSMHAYNTSAALTLRLKGGERAIDKACQLIDNEAHFTCILDERMLQKLLRMLVGVAADQELDKLDRLVLPASDFGV